MQRKFQNVELRCDLWRLQCSRSVERNIKNGDPEDTSDLRAFTGTEKPQGSWSFGCGSEICGRKFMFLKYEQAMLGHFHKHCPIPWKR
jgi:hypothetical protein